MTTKLERIRKITKTNEGKIMFIGLTIIVTLSVIAILAPYIVPYDPSKTTSDVLLPPSLEHPFGTDNLGRDILSRIIYGSRISISTALLGAVISLPIGVLLGEVSGYLGGKLDKILSVIMDSIYAFPSLILAISVATILGAGIINTALAVATVFVPTYFRVTRGQVLSIKSKEFVEAARLMGASKASILLKDIFPNTVASIFAIFSVNTAWGILIEAGLSFLGLGIPPPNPSWGTDIRIGRLYYLSGYWWMITFPGLAILLASLGFTFFGQGLQKIISPEERRS